MIGKSCPAGGGQRREVAVYPMSALRDRGLFAFAHVFTRPLHPQEHTARVPRTTYWLLHIFNSLPEVMCQC